MSGKLRLAPYYSIFNPTLLKEACLEQESTECPALTANSVASNTYTCKTATESTESCESMEETTETSTCIINDPISYVSDIEYTNETLEEQPCCHTKSSLEILRDSIMGEILAISAYEEIIQKATDFRVKQAICHISNDERAHMADQLSVLNNYDQIQAEQFKNSGWKNVKTRFRHVINGQNQNQMLIHLQTHLLEELEPIIVDYLDANLASVLTGCSCLPKHLQCFIQQHQPIEDYLDCIPQPIMEQFAKFFFQIIPESFVCQYQQAMQEQAQEILARIAEEHNCPAILNKAGNQILCYLQNYLMDYLLTASIVSCTQTNNTYIIEEKALTAPTAAATVQEEIPVAEPAAVTAQENKAATVPVQENKAAAECPAIDATAKQCSSVPSWLPLIRKALTDELAAVNFYNTSIAQIEEEDIKHSFCGAMNIEKEHVATLTQILRYYDQALKEELALHGWSN